MNDKPEYTDCPVCKTRLRQPASTRVFGTETQLWPGYRFDCPHCGQFDVDRIELNHLLGYLNPNPVAAPPPSENQLSRHRAVLAHAICRMGEAGQIPVLKNGMTWNILQEDRLPSFAEQKDNLLRWFGKKHDIEHGCWIDYAGLGARIGSSSSGSFRLVLESMIEEALLHGNFAMEGAADVRLAHRGLERLEQLERATPSGYNAFMAMEFGDDILDRVVDDFFKPAVKETGFELFRLDDRPEAGLIDARLRNEIRNCRFLVADLSHANAGSYWEAGYAEGLGKPVIYTCEKAVFEGRSSGVSKPHFDTNHHLTVIWDAENPKLAADRLKETIRFTIPEAKQG